MTVMRSAVLVTLVAGLTAYTDAVVTGLGQLAPEDLQQAFKENISAHQGRMIRPLGVDATHRYHSLVRAYTVPSLTFIAVLDAVVVLAMLALAVPVTLFLGGDRDADLRWILEMLLGVCALPLVLAAGLYFWLWVMQHRSRFAVLVATALALTFLPPLLTYLAGGDAELSGRSAVVSALIAAVVSAVVDLAKEYIARPAASKGAAA